MEASNNKVSNTKSKYEDEFQTPYILTGEQRWTRKKLCALYNPVRENALF